MVGKARCVLFGNIIVAFSYVKSFQISEDQADSGCRCQKQNQSMEMLQFHVNIIQSQFSTDMMGEGHIHFILTHKLSKPSSLDSVHSAISQRAILMLTQLQTSRSNVLKTDIDVNQW